MGCNVTAAYKAYKRGAFFANPCFTQIHPTCIPVKGDYQSKLTLMSESLRNSGRIWVPKSRETAEKSARRKSSLPTFPKKNATTTWNASIPPSATWLRATSPPAPPRKPATTAAA